MQAVLDDPAEQFDMSRMCRMGEEMASALDHVHQLGVAHLDLKPANVMITAQHGNYAAPNMVNMLFETW